MKKWYVAGLFNLFILALLGLILRYKINFSLPFLDYTNVLHAHSHFAFNGWISFLLQVLIVEHFSSYQTYKKFWNRFFIISTVINYATIISFAAVGYAGSSIALSTISLLLSYAFVYKIYKTQDDKKNDKVSTAFVQASLFFLVLSSIGPYALAILMATNNTNYYLTQNVLHFFLHFQYNGWFTFAILSFFFRKIESKPFFKDRAAQSFFKLTTFACIPSYLFTTIWDTRPSAVTIVMLVTVLIQTVSLYQFYKILRTALCKINCQRNTISKVLYSIAVVAFVSKIILQFTSVYTPLAMVFSSRSIVIAYLHLVFLGFVSTYLIAFLIERKTIKATKPLALTGVILFIAGVIINEILLIIQGVAPFYSWDVAQTHLLLFANTFILVIGAFLLFATATASVFSNKTNYKPSKLYYGTIRNTRYTTA